MAINFTGRYEVNANQTMPTKDACLKRDASIGFWAQRSKDGEKIHSQLKDFYTGDYKTNPSKPLNIVFDIPDSEDKNFEETMNMVGQKFNKLA